MSSSLPQKVVHAVVSARDDIALILEWTRGADLDALKADRKLRYAVERAFIAIDASIRDIPS